MKLIFVQSSNARSFRAVNGLRLRRQSHIKLSELILKYNLIVPQNELSSSIICFSDNYITVYSTNKIMLLVKMLPT